MFDNVKTKKKDVALELVKKTVTKDGSFKLALALNSVLYRVQDIDPSHFKRLGTTKNDDMIEQLKW